MGTIMDAVHDLIKDGVSMLKWPKGTLPEHVMLSVRSQPGTDGFPSLIEVSVSQINPDKKSMGGHLHAYFTLSGDRISIPEDYNS